MVRLRSERWFSVENQREMRRSAPSNSSGSRRLISLLFLLALVILLMQRAADPKYVRAAFKALGVPLERSVAASTHESPTAITEPDSERTESTLNESDAASASSVWQATCQDLFPRILDDVSVNDFHVLAQFLFVEAQSQMQPAKLSQPWHIDVSATIEPLRAELARAESTDAEWTAALGRFGIRWQDLESQLNAAMLESSGSIPEAVQPDDFTEWLKRYVDQRLIDQMRSASPWSPDETIAFGRWLQRGQSYEFTMPEPPEISARQLADQFDQLRGKWIRLRGTVHRVESVNRTQPFLAEARYYVLWMRGQDNSSQPIPVYTTHSMAKQMATLVEAGDLPEIEIDALVGKKLAYSAPGGVQVSPAVCAGSIIQFVSDGAPARFPSTESTIRQVGISAFIGIAIGILAIMPIWRQLRRKSRRVATAWLMFCVLNVFGSTVCCAQTPPWVKSESSIQPAEIIRQRLQSAYTLEQLMQIRELLGGDRMAVADSILRTLFAVNQLGWNQIAELNQPIPLAEGLELRVTLINGWAKSTQVLPLSDVQQEWFSLEHTKQIYRLQIEPAVAQQLEKSQPRLVSVFCNQVPQAWKTSPQLNQPVQVAALGLFVSEGSADDQTAICFFANQPRWQLSAQQLAQPEELHPTLTALMKSLALSGWDLSWNDTLASNNQKRLSATEADALLTMMRIAASNAPADSTDLLSPLDAMRSPKKSIGSPVDWNVRLVNGRRIEIEHAGANHSYFQLDGFVRIPNQTVNYTIPDTGQSLSFKDEFPVTIVTTVADSLVDTDQSEESPWEIDKLVRVRGNFLRLWSYESEKLTTSTNAGRQVAPLVAGGSFSLGTPEPIKTRQSVWFTYVLGLALLAIMWGIVRSTYQSSLRKRKAK